MTLTKDEGIRPGTNYESLAKLRAAFPQWGGYTAAGSVSQVTDGGKDTLFCPFLMESFD